MFSSIQATPTATAILLLSTLTLWAQEAAPIYPTPQAALETLIAAMETGEVGAAINAIDPAASDLVQGANPAATVATLKQLLGLYNAGYRFVPTDNGATIALGEDGWPFPIPLVSGPQGWSFDVEAGRQEIQDREVGGNELDVIGVLEHYLQVQTAYRTVDHDGDGVLEFAAAIISSDDRHDGLFWPGGDSPVGDIAARASLDGYGEDGKDQPPEPLNGYYFRILSEQGPAAPGGAMSYIINGNMVAGHAALAIPAEYGLSGVHSFMISEAGTLYQADLGDQTLDLGFALNVFDPSQGWEPVR